MRGKSAALAAMSALLAAAALPNITPGARVISASEASSVSSQHGQAPAKAPGAAWERFFRSGWTRGSKAPRGKRVSHSVAQDRRIAKKVRNVKRSKR